MNHEGIGLGLNISKQIVEQTGGQIYASSQGLGFGSQFTFSMIMPPEERIQEPEYDNIRIRMTPRSKRGKQLDLDRFNFIHIMPRP